MLTTTTTTLLALLSSGHRFVHESGKIIALNDDQIELFADADRLDAVAEPTKVLSLEEFFRSDSLSVRGGSFKGRQAQLVGLTPEFVKVVLLDSLKRTRIKKRFVGVQKKGVRRSPRLATMSSSSSADLPDLSLMKIVESVSIESIRPSETGPTEDFGSSSADFHVDESADGSKSCVRWASELVSSVRTRPKTPKEDIAKLFWSKAEQQQSKRKKRDNPEWKEGLLLKTKLSRQEIHEYRESIIDRATFELEMGFPPGQITLRGRRRGRRGNVNGPTKDCGNSSIGFGVLQADPPTEDFCSSSADFHVEGLDEPVEPVEPVETVKSVEPVAPPAPKKQPAQSTTSSLFPSAYFIARAKARAQGKNFSRGPRHYKCFGPGDAKKQTAMIRRLTESLRREKAAAAEKRAKHMTG